jgi:hypothetical protein
MTDHNCLTNTQCSDLLAPLPKCIIQKRFILPVSKILKSTNFIFHLSDCNSLTSTKFFSPSENYSTKSGDNEPSLTPVNREGLACWAASNPKLLCSCYWKIYINSVQMTKIHQVTVLRLIISFANNNNDYCNFVLRWMIDTFLEGGVRDRHSVHFCLTIHEQHDMWTKKQDPKEN